jgi:hypothetical protein
LERSQPAWHDTASSPFEHYFRGFDLKARDGPGIIDFNATTTHDLRSMTKSVTALVLGAAIDNGLIVDVDQFVLSFFPDYADLRTPEKDRITIGICLRCRWASPGTMMRLTPMRMR